MDKVSSGKMHMELESMILSSPTLKAQVLERFYCVVDDACRPLPL
jgi:hypothetical protein